MTNLKNFMGGTRPLHWPHPPPRLWGLDFWIPSITNFWLRHWRKLFFEFSFSGFRRFRTQQQLNEWNPYCQRQSCKHVEFEQCLACFRVERVCQRQLGFLVLFNAHMVDLVTVMINLPVRRLKIHILSLSGCLFCRNIHARRWVTSIDNNKGYPHSL